jgi:serine O-acetyltransferase
MALCQLIRSDYRRYRAAGAGSALGVILLTQGFWASTVYRLNHHLHRHLTLPGFRQLARMAGLLAHKAVEIITGISLPPELEVGEGLYIGHFGPIIVSPEARLGRHCNLSQGVTIGLGGRGDRRGAPVLGNRVYVGAGAILFGPLSVGDDAAVGAGAVVTRSVPARGVVAGNPARLISQAGSFEFVRYDGMSSDPERAASLSVHSPDPGPEDSDS